MNDIKRVILKLSGEALSGDKKSGYDDELIMDIAGQVKQIIDKGINVGVVIGGGNYYLYRLLTVISLLSIISVNSLACCRLYCYQLTYYLLLCHRPLCR